VEIPREGAGALVLDPREELARDAEARGHDAAGRPGVHAFRQDFHGEQRADHAAQRGRAPELVVVPAPGVEADHQVRLADLRRAGFHIGGQIGAAALLACLDQHDEPRVRRARPLHGFDGRERAEGRVAVVLSPAPVEAIAPPHGRPGPEAFAPPDHLGLLVAVAVEQDGLGRRPRHFHQDDGRAAGETDGLDREAFDGPAPAPLLDEGGRLVDVAVRGPVGIEGRRLGRNLDVAGERGKDVFLPAALNKSQCLSDGQRARGCRAHGRPP
jgi:hypothetical protein